MGKIFFYALLRHLVTLAIAFIAAKGVISAGVANRLNAGDTVDLWNSGYKVSVQDIVNYLAAVALPVALTVMASAWGRVKSAYQLLRARLTPRSLTSAEVKEIVANTPASQIIKAVANQ